MFRISRQEAGNENRRETGSASASRIDWMFDEKEAFWRERVRPIVGAVARARSAHAIEAPVAGLRLLMSNFLDISIGAA